MYNLLDILPHEKPSWIVLFDMRPGSRKVNDKHALCPRHIVLLVAFDLFGKGVHAILLDHQRLVFRTNGVGIDEIAHAILLCRIVAVLVLP